MSRSTLDLFYSSAASTAGKNGEKCSKGDTSHIYIYTSGNLGNAALRLSCMVEMQFFLFSMDGKGNPKDLADAEAFHLLSLR